MKVAILSTGRHDLSYVKPIHQAIPGSYVLEVSMGTTVSQWRAAEKTMHAGLAIHNALTDDRPDCFLVIGDRSETLACCVVATVLRIPIAHVHGGDVTLGSIDNACRHAISQLAQWHFCAHEQAASVLRYMNVPGAIHVSGSPAIDLILANPRKRAVGRAIVLAYHPETMSNTSPLEQIRHAAAIALENLPKGGKVVYVGANPDAGGEQMNLYLGARGEPFVVRTGMDSEEYWDALSTCHALVGNSSSGVIECPVLGVPFIEIGDRQKGRWRGSYGDGHACERIASVLTQQLSSRP